MSYTKSNQIRVFLVDTSYQGGETIMTWRLDQMCALPCGQAQENRLYNQVQKHLSELSVRTGFDYRIRFWGALDYLDSYIEEQGLEVS